MATDDDSARPPRPDWATWRHMGKVRLAQAIALSLDICPEWLESVIDPDDFGDIDSATANLLHALGKHMANALVRRWRIVLSRRGEFDPYLNLVPEQAAGRWNVDLKAFARIAQKIFEDLPAEMAHLAAPVAHEVPHDQPTGADSLSDDTDHVPKSTRQEDRILEVICSLGYDPLALPLAGGRDGVKKAVREICRKDVRLFTHESFDKAWQRLRDSGALRDRPR